MKKLFISFILGLLGLSLTGCGTSVGYYSDADKYTAGNKEYNDVVLSLDVDWISGNLTLVPDIEVNGVFVNEETNITNEKGLVHSYFNNGELKIKYGASGYHFPTSFKQIKKDLEIRYNPTTSFLNKINIDLTSGRLTAKEINTREFSLDMTSGRANIQSLTCEKGDVDLTSGELTITSLSADEFDVDMTSGYLNVSFLKECQASFDMTSGTIKTTLPSEGGTVKVSKTSGSVTTNRECAIQGNTYTFGNGNTNIKVSMTSGKLIIS